MLGGHLPELFIVLTLALVIFGPKRLPEIGSSLGQSIRAFRKGIASLEDERVRQDMPERVEPHQISATAPDQKAG